MGTSWALRPPQNQENNVFPTGVARRSLGGAACEPRSHMLSVWKLCASGGKGRRPKKENPPRLRTDAKCEPRVMHRAREQATATKSRKRHPMSMDPVWLEQGGWPKRPNMTLLKNLSSAVGECVRRLTDIIRLHFHTLNCPCSAVLSQRRYHATPSLKFKVEAGTDTKKLQWWMQHLPWGKGGWCVPRAGNSSPYPARA